MCFTRIYGFIFCDPKVINSSAIKNITRSGTTFTATKLNGGTFTFTQQDSNTTYGAATTSALGLVKTGSNITNSSGTISISKTNVTTALGYTPPTTNTNTTYGTVTTSSNGLMIASDKRYFDKIKNKFSFINEVITTSKSYTLANCAYLLLLGGAGVHIIYSIFVYSNSGRVVKISSVGSFSGVSPSISGKTLTINNPNSISVVVNCKSLLYY